MELKKEFLRMSSLVVGRGLMRTPRSTKQVAGIWRCSIDLAASYFGEDEQQAEMGRGRSVSGGFGDLEKYRQRFLHHDSAA